VNPTHAFAAFAIVAPFYHLILCAILRPKDPA
jgi:hypothetical protein